MRLRALLVLLLSGIVAAQEPLPPTPAQRVLTAWLAALASTDAAALQAFDATYRPDAPALSVTTRLRDSTGGFRLLRIETSTLTSLTALLEEKDARGLARLDLVVTDGPPPKVVSSTLRRVTRTADLQLRRLTEDETIKELSEKLDEESRADRFSGAVLIGHRGRVVFQKAAGHANRELRVPNTVETKFRNGSMNKMFTATAVLQLVEAGKLSLDDTVGKVMPDYPNPDVARKVTIRHLLGHTGGTGDFFGPEFVKNRLTLKTHSDYVALFGNRPPLFEPGSEYRYSNYGMVLLGAIIERVTGTTYFDHVEKHVFAPAGMRSTGSLPETEAVSNRSLGYMRTKDAWAPNSETLPWSGTAAGGGYSTVGDFFRFAEALQSGKLISKVSLTQMTTPGLNAQYGFGMLLVGRGSTRYIGHSGGAPGQNGDLRSFPESGYVIVVLSNLDPPAASRLSDFIMARLPLTGPAAAVPPVTVIDDFESGTLDGWTLNQRGSGRWFPYRSGRQAPDPGQSNTFIPFHMPDPPQGAFAAVSDAAGPGMQLMYRDIALTGPMMLELTVFYVSGTDGLSGYSGPFSSPRTLALNAGPNQQFRVDILSTGAAGDSMADSDIRATVFETPRDAPGRLGPVAVRFDMSPWEGQSVRLRIASVGNQAPMRAGVDNVRLIPIER